MNSKYLYSGSTQSQREVTGLFSSWSHASWWNERGRAPLGAVGDLSEQYFFFGEAFLFLTRKRNGSNTLLCNNKIFYMGSYIDVYKRQLRILYKYYIHMIMKQSEKRESDVLLYSSDYLNNYLKFLFISIYIS